MSRLILALLREPGVAQQWGAREWADVLPRLMQSGLAGHVAVLLEQAGVQVSRFPAGVIRQLRAASIACEAELRSLRWELGELERALRPVGQRVLLLKGADYVSRRSTPSFGRTVADVDVLVLPADLSEVHRAVFRAGWGTGEEQLGPNDIHLPTLTHSLRRTQLELHCRIVGELGPERLEPASFFERATWLVGGPLGLPDTVDSCLVCVAHYVRNKRPVSAFRDLLDLRELIRDFTLTESGFPSRLLTRAQELQFGGSLARAIRDVEKLFGQLGLAEVDDFLGRQRPVLGGGSVAALIPDGAQLPSMSTRLARVGRTYARMRSSRSVRQTIGALWDLLRSAEQPHA